MRRTSSSSHVINYTIISIASLCALGVVMFCWTMYLPYHKMREENYSKELRVLQEICASGLIPGDFQINSVTYGGKATNCSQAFVFTQIPIVFGALSDMWDDSIIKFVIYGGNWKIQCIFATCAIFAIYHLTKALVTLIISSQMIEQFNPGRQVAKLIQGPSNNSQHLIIPKKSLFDNPSIPAGIIQN